MGAAFGIRGREKPLVVRNHTDSGIVRISGELLADLHQMHIARYFEAKLRDM